MYQFTLQKSIQNKVSLYKTNSKFKWASFIIFWMSVIYTMLSYIWWM
jgi:hypothetical protein